MSRFLNTKGRNPAAVAICGRCGLKMWWGELQPDPNSPGLMVCRKDLDQYDPYRLPPRQSENITLAFVRPDLPLDGTSTPYDDPSQAVLVLQGPSQGSELVGGDGDGGEYSIQVEDE